MMFLVIMIEYYDTIILLRENNYLPSLIFFLQKISIQNCFWAEFFLNFQLIFKSFAAYVRTKYVLDFHAKKIFCLQVN